MTGQKMLSVGETATGAILWDAIRSPDALAVADLPQVARPVAPRQVTGGRVVGCCGPEEGSGC
jgi:hypothetical protein